MALLASIKDVFDSGDPIIRSWTLVQSYWTPFICSVLYVFFVKRLGPSLMSKRQPFDLRYLMIIYNFSIVFVYATCLLTIIYTALTTDAYKLICTPLVLIENHYTYTVAIACWYIYILKYVEFADTIFFLLRKKFHLITNLQVIHHAALPIICWIFMRTETSGFQVIVAGINSFMHIIMYTYYGLAAMGPEVQKKLWWKEYLTLMQMTQFVVIFLIVFVIVPISGCKTTQYGIYIDAFFSILFFLMFFNFYKKAYKKSIDGSPQFKADGGHGTRKQNDACLKES